MEGLFIHVILTASVLMSWCVCVCVHPFVFVYVFIYLCNLRPAQSLLASAKTVWSAQSIVETSLHSMSEQSLRDKELSSRASAHGLEY